MSAGKEVGVRLKVGADGLENIVQLGDKLDEAGAAAQALGDKAEQLTRDLDRLEGEQALIEQFNRTKTAVTEAGAAMDAAKAEARELGQALAQTAAPTDAQAAAAERSRLAAVGAEQAYEAEVAALRALREPLSQAGLSSEGLATAQQRVTQQLTQTRESVLELAQGLQAIGGEALANFGRLAEDTEQARQAFLAADGAVETFKRGIVDINAPTQAEARELARLTDGARQVQLAFQQQSLEAAQAATALRAAGASAEQLAAAQGKVRTQTSSSAAGIESATASTRGLTAAQLAAEREIQQINAALDKMAFNARVSGDEFDKAFTTGQQRIAKLRAEAVTVPPALDAGARSANLLGDGIRRAAAYFSAFTIGRQFVEANTQIESLRRTLVLITGSTDKASQQLAFLKKTADDTGVSVASLAGPFAKFVASAGAAGVSLDTVDHLFASVTKASALLGLSSEDTAGALLALGQMASKGKVSMEELGQQLGDRLPAVLATTAKGLGITTDEMIKLIDKGGLLADESFFRSFAKGVDETFVKGAGKVAGFQAELGRLKTTWNDFLVSLGDSGLLAALSATLQLLGPILSGVAAAFVVLGKTIGVAAAAAVELASALATIDGSRFVRALVQGKDAARELADELGKHLPESFRMLDIFGVRTKAATDEQKKLADGGAATAKAVAQTGDAAKAAAVAHESLAAGTKAAGAEATVANDRWVALTVAYDKMIDKAGKAAESSAKLADAKKTEGENSVALAAIAGNEVRQRQAGTDAADANAKALLAVASAKQSEADLTQIKIAALRQEAIDTGTLTDARKKELVELELKLKGLQAEAKGSNEAAEAAKNEATARAVAVAVVKDNSGALAELKVAYESAASALVTVTAAEKAGAATKGEVQDAARRAAAAEALYHDALDDTAGALDRRATQVKLGLSLTEASLNLEKAQLQAELDLAKLDGRTDLALDLRIKLKENEIKLIEAKIAATVAEAKATLAGAEATKAALAAEGKLTEQKKLEIEATIKGAQVKLLEAEAAGKNVDVLKKQLENLRVYGTEAGNASDKSRKLAGSYNDLAAAGGNSAAQTILQKIALGQYITEAEATVLANTHLVGSFNSLADAGRNARVKSKLGTNTYDPVQGTATDASGQPIVVGQQANVGEGMFFDKAAYDRDVANAFRAGSQRIVDPQKYVKPIPAPVVDDPAGIVAAELARVAAITGGNPGGSASGASQFGAAAPAPAPAPVATPTATPSSVSVSGGGGTRTLNLQINGGPATEVTVASTSDAAALESFLLRLAQDASRTGAYP
ncbi:MAG: tape measure protein [Burkholderiaceae bacterium]